MRQGWLDSIRQDRRYAVRVLCRRPLRFVAVAASLALAACVTTAMVTNVHALLLQPVPFKDPKRLAHLPMGPESDGRPKGNDRVLLSEDGWRTLYGAGQSTVGRSISVNGQPMLIAGVLPRGFTFPTWNPAVWRGASVTGPAEPSIRGTAIDRVFTKPIQLTPGVRGIARLRITGSDWRQLVAVEFVVTLQGRRIYEFAEKDVFLPEHHFSQESFPECRGFVSCKQPFYNTLFDSMVQSTTRRRYLGDAARSARGSTISPSDLTWMRNTARGVIERQLLAQVPDERARKSEVAPFLTYPPIVAEPDSAQDNPREAASSRGRRSSARRPPTIDLIRYDGHNS